MPGAVTPPFASNSLMANIPAQVVMPETISLPEPTMYPPVIKIDDAVEEPLRVTPPSLMRKPALNAAGPVITSDPDNVNGSPLVRLAIEVVAETDIAMGVESLAPMTTSSEASVEPGAEPVLQLAPLDH